MLDCNGAWGKIMAHTNRKPRPTIIQFKQITDVRVVKCGKHLRVLLQRPYSKWHSVFKPWNRINISSNISSITLDSRYDSYFRLQGVTVCRYFPHIMENAKITRETLKASIIERKDT